MSKPRRFVPCLYGLSESVPGSWWKKHDKDPVVVLKCSNKKNQHISQISEDRVSGDGDIDGYECPEKDCEYNGDLHLVDWR